MKSYSILFVCMGNICRSPTAHGVFRHKVREQGLAHVIHVDSAGTHNYHPGSAPDDRSQQHAAQRGYQLSDLRARQIMAEDFDQHDLILVMDWDNMALVQDICPPAHRKRCEAYRVLLEVRQRCGSFRSYYGGADGFDHVLNLVEDAAEGLLRYARRHIE